MPLSRKKACSQCRRAKARCNLSLPECRRCVDRRLSCNYYFEDTVESMQSVPTPAQTATPTTSLGDDLREPPPRSGLPTLEAEQGRPCGGFDWNIFGAETLGNDFLFGSTAPDSLTLQVPDFDGIPGYPSGNDRFPRRPNIPSEGKSNKSPRGVDIGSGILSNYLEHDEGIGALATKRSVRPGVFLATKVMLGQIESYPTMLVNGHSLPPFIHSCCALDDSISFECQAKDFHHCLPESLAICASLVHMFHTKTDASRGFVWNSIYQEMGRLCRECSECSHEKLLETTQAMCIYVILQSKDTESLSKNNVEWMIQTLQTISVKLHFKSDYDTPQDSMQSPLSRKDWVLLESTRRTISLLYVIETLLEVALRSGDPRCCQTFLNAPLPCTRELWEVASTHEWTKRYKVYLGGRVGSTLLTVGDIKSLQSTDGDQFSSRNRPGDTTGDLLKWCEGMDQFGLTLWMASSLVKFQPH